MASDASGSATVDVMLCDGGGVANIYLIPIAFKFGAKTKVHMLEI